MSSISMSSIQIQKIIGTLGAAAAIAATPSFVSAQGPQGGLVYDLTRPRPTSVDTSNEATEAKYSFRSRSDSISWERNKSIAEHSTGFRIVVSLQDKHIWAIIGEDTVLSAPAAVAKGTTLQYGRNMKWTFTTPRGIRTVLGKEADPIWQPPLWLYAETAEEYGLKLREMRNGERIKLSDGRILTMEDGEAGVIEDGQFASLPTDEHIVFDNTLFVPPMGSKNRKVEGELGKYRLILGDGYLLHGTPYKESIGLAATHGCVRLRDEDIEWLYDHVPVGTKVYIY